MTGMNEIDDGLDLLLRMRERLSDPANWCGDGGQELVDERNRLYSGERGESWCLVRTASRLDTTGVWEEELWDLVCRLTYPKYPADWNDTHTHAEVLELLDVAIAERTKKLAAA